MGLLTYFSAANRNARRRERERVGAVRRRYAHYQEDLRWLNKERDQSRLDNARRIGWAR